MFLREEVKDDLIKKCTLNELPYDLARIFITQDGINSQDLFRYKYSLVNDKKFYKDVFEYLYNYTIDKVQKGNYTLIMRDILSKMSCTDYYLTFNDKINYIEHDYLVSKWFEDIILFVYKTCDIYDFFSFISSIRTLGSVDHNIIKNVILFNRSLWDYELFKLLIQDNLLDFDFIYELFIKLYDFYPQYMLNELLMEIYQHKDVFMGFVNYLLEKYSYSTNKKREYVMFIKYNITSPKEKTVLKYLRREITKLIDTDVELEILEHINYSLANSMLEGNPRNKELWNTLKRFITSHERKQNRISNFSNYGTEDSYEMYDDDFISDLYLHVFTLAYINDLPYLDDWNTFLRVFNLNRFYFSHTRNQIRIQVQLQEIVNVYAESVKFATNLKLYLYMYENSEQK